MNDEELLCPGNSARSDPGLKGQIERQTLSVVRANRRWRQVRSVATGVALFTAGVGTHAMTFGSKANVAEPVSTEPPAVAVPKPEDSPAESPEKVPRSAPKSAAEMELLAEQLTDPVAMARAFRLAGDRYYETERNYAAALRCYRSFLRAAQAADLQESPDDNVLLTTLKSSRKLELQS